MPLMTKVQEAQPVGELVSNRASCNLASSSSYRTAHVSQRQNALFLQHPGSQALFCDNPTG